MSAYYSKTSNSSFFDEVETSYDCRGGQKFSKLDEVQSDGIQYIKVSDGYSAGYTLPQAQPQLEEEPKIKVSGIPVLNSDWRKLTTTEQALKIAGHYPAVRRKLIDFNEKSIKEKCIVSYKDSLYEVDMVLFDASVVSILVLNSLADGNVLTLDFSSNYQDTIDVLGSTDHFFTKQDIFTPKIIVINSTIQDKKGAHNWGSIDPSHIGLHRLENTKNGNYKFWAIWITCGPTQPFLSKFEQEWFVWYDYGSIGGESNIDNYKNKTFKSQKSAEEFVNTKLTEMQNKGYEFI